jgi:hypothetical protein
MKLPMKLLCLITAAAVASSAVVGCAKKTTKKVTVETPEKKYEVEVEKTERK